jgi:Asp-tRNA(Asn)/Glu-tRNA(Gln) amidotransferase C subunit
MAIDKEKLEKKIGETIGLEMAAQKAVEDLSEKGLLPNERTLKYKLEGMRKQANNHQTKMEDLVSKLSQSDALDSSKIQQMAHETEQKATKMMETYLRKDPDSQEALQFLCLAEAGEVTHYEVLNALTKGVKNKQFGTKVKSILVEEKKHLILCTRLAKKYAIASSQ